MSSQPDSDADGNPSPARGQVPRCPNCGTPTPDSFCPHCGQETLLEPPTVAASFLALVGRDAAFGGPLWKTLAKLFFAPGALTIDFVAGRRARYLRPLQLYLAASVIVFASAQLFGLNLGLRLNGDQGMHLVRASSLPAADGSSLGSRWLTVQTILDHIDTPAVRRFQSMSQEDRFKFLRARRIQYVSSFVLLLVPVYALILQLCYRNRRRHYSEHLLFGLHAHSFLLFMLLIEAKLPAILANIASLWVITYFHIALKRVYGGTWIETIARGTAMLALYFATFIVANVLLIVALLEL